MTDQKTSALPEATSLASTDLLYAVVGNQSRRMTAKSFGQEMTGVIDAKRDHDVTFDGVTNDSVNLQAAIDAAAAKAVTTGFNVAVMLAPGNAKCNVALKDKVWLISPIRWATRLTAFSTGVVVDTPASLISDCGLDGVKINAGGAAFGGTGVRFQNVNRGVVRGCFFDQIDNQAVLWEDGFTCIFEDNFAQNCLLDRAQAAKIGVIEFGSLTTDGWLVRGEYTASLSGTANKSDANLYLCAGLIKGAAHNVDGGIFEISDIGLRVEANDSRLVGPRADLNQGHGFEITGSVNQLIAPYSLNNSQDANDTYDGFSVSGVNNTFSSAVARSNITNKHRYGLDDTVNSDANKNFYENSRSFGAVTGGWNVVAFAGSSVSFSEGPQRTFTDLDTTPSVDQYRNFRANNTGATTITDFDDGVSGQKITIFAGTGNTTLNYAGANLSGNGGVNRLLASSSVTTLMLQNGVWYETGYAV